MRTVPRVSKPNLASDLPLNAAWLMRHDQLPPRVHRCRKTTRIYGSDHHIVRVGYESSSACDNSRYMCMTACVSVGLLCFHGIGSNCEHPTAIRRHRNNTSSFRGGHIAVCRRAFSFPFPIARPLRLGWIAVAPDIQEARDPSLPITSYPIAREMEQISRLLQHSRDGEISRSTDHGTLVGMSRN